MVYSGRPTTNTHPVAQISLHNGQYNQCLVTCDLLRATDHHCCQGLWQQDSACCSICLSPVLTPHFVSATAQSRNGHEVHVPLLSSGFTISAQNAVFRYSMSSYSLFIFTLLNRNGLVLIKIVFLPNPERITPRKTD